MAKDHTYFYIGHSLLDLGLIGFITDNNYVALATLGVSFICFLVAAGVVRIAKDREEGQSISNYFRRNLFMIKENKVILTVIVCTLLLAGLQLFLNRQAIGITL